MRRGQFSLFFQIFAWFWATIALSGSALLMVEWFSVQPPMSFPQRAIIEKGFRAEMVEAKLALAQGGTAKLSRQLAAFEAQTGVDTYWIDTTGQTHQDVRGKKLPRSLRVSVKEASVSPSPAFSWRVTGWWIDTAIPVKPGTVFAVRFERNPFTARTGARFARFLVVFLTAGLICWLLAKHFTRPITQLRVATNQLAGGDFSARAAVKENGRRDELSLLARDFNGMASQIELLVGAQGRLIGDVSHELRSPLTRLKLALALARRDAPPEPKLAGHLDRITSESEALEELVGELLTLSRLENRLETPSGTRFDWAKTVAGVASDLEWEAQSRTDEVNIYLDFQCEEAFVFGDEALLTRAVENVARNALRFAPAKSDIVFKLWTENGAFKTTIRDAGRGVPEEQLDAIFRPFYRVETARDRKEGDGGTGLGLAIARRAVESHGGTIVARNVVPHGLEVEIGLPAAK